MFERIRARISRRGQGIGRANLALYAFVYLVRKLSFSQIVIDYRYLLVQPVPETSILKGRTPGRLTVRVLEGDALREANAVDEGGAFSRPPRDEARFERRVARGDTCFAVYADTRAEGVLWLSYGAFDEPDVKAVFRVWPEHLTAWDSNLYVVEDARAGFHFAILWDAANAFLRTKGYTHVATQTSAFNGPSLQAHRRMGSRRFGWMLYLIVGPIHLTFSSLRPRVAVTGHRGIAPVYDIPPPATMSLRD